MGWYNAFAKTQKRFLAFFCIVCVDLSNSNNDLLQNTVQIKQK